MARRSTLTERTLGADKLAKLILDAVAATFDPVSMDGSMPDVGGFDASHRIRRRETDGGAETRRTPSSR